MQNLIKYSYTQLINWNKELEIDGTANLISISDSISTIKEYTYEAPNRSTDS